MTRLYKCIFQNLVEFFISWRMFSGLLLLIGGMDVFLREIRNACIRDEMKLTPWGLPLLFNSSYFMLVFISIFLFLISIYPLDRKRNCYVIARIGTRKWIRLQGVCLIVISIMYILTLYVIEVLLLFPVLQFNMKWSDGWIKLSEESYCKSVGSSLTIPASIVQNESVFLSNLKFILFFFGILIFTSFVVLYFSQIRNFLGILIASAGMLIGLSQKVSGTLLFFSPYCWFRDIKRYSIRYPGNPGEKYIALFLTLACILFYLSAEQRCRTIQENNRRRR